MKEAFSIDSKLDDGLPQSGKVTATYLNSALNHGCDPDWASGGNVEGAFGAGAVLNSIEGANYWTFPPATAATLGSAITCYDNSTSPDGQTATAGIPQHYSLEISGGAAINCALSFQFQ